MEFPESSTNTCTATVEADEYSATVETETLLTNDERRLRLEFYHGAATLHWDHSAFIDCE